MKRSSIALPILVYLALLADQQSTTANALALVLSKEDLVQLYEE